MRLLWLLFLAVSLPAHAAKGNGGPSPASQMQAGGVHGGGGGGRRYEDPRRAPPMEPKRKVNEQDCSKPVNLDAGNLKCK